MGLKEHVKALEDRPLQEGEEALFVDRREELRKMAELAEYFEGKIIGVGGSRGIGKSTLFNMAKFPGRNKLIIRVIDRESKLSVVANITAEILRYGERKGYGEVVAKAASLLERVRGLEKESVGISYVLHLSYEKERAALTFDLLREFKELLHLLERRGKLVIILDEIDKERAEEILLILDALKDAFLSNSITLFVALPAAFHDEYIASKVSGEETHNLENVLAYMFALPPLSDDEIVALLEKRFPLELVEEKALALITLFAEGNPRRAITTLKEAGMLASERVREEDVKAVLHRYLKTWMRKQGIGERELAVLKVLEEGSVAEVTKKAAKKLRKARSTIYKYIERLAEKGLLRVKGKDVVLTRRGQLLRLLF